MKYLSNLKETCNKENAKTIPDELKTTAIPLDHINKLLSYITQTKNRPNVISTNVQYLNNELSTANITTTHLNNKIDHLNSRCDIQTAQLIETKSEVNSLNNERVTLKSQLCSQSLYLSHLGAVTGAILWKLSSNQTIDASDNLEELLLLSEKAMCSFLNTYACDNAINRGSYPKDNENEMKFCIAISGIVSNMTASGEGRDKICRLAPEILVCFLRCLRTMEANRCTTLKSLQLTSLYNASISTTGVKEIAEYPNVTNLLLWLIREERTNTIRTTCLKLLISITIYSPELLHKKDLVNLQCEFRNNSEMSPFLSHIQTLVNT